MSDGSLRGNRSRRWQFAFGLVFATVFVGNHLHNVWTIHQHQEWLAARGLSATGVVVDTARENDTQLVRVRYQSSKCHCEVGAWVSITDSSESRHAVGTKMPIRYDPDHPTIADARIDRPNPYSFVLFVFGGLAVVAALFALGYLAVWLVRRIRGVEPRS